MATEKHDPIRHFPPGPEVMPHRKNAAEWMMWMAIMPMAWTWRLFASVFGFRANPDVPERRQLFQHEG